MRLARSIALVLGLALLGTFIVVMTVHYLLPLDPLNPEPQINYRALFAAAFVTLTVALGITHLVSRRSS